MLPRLSTLKALPTYLRGYWRFMRREKAVTRRQLALVLALATATVAAEAAGMTMLLPILSYVEHGGDIATFANSSRVTRFIVDAYEYIGLPISLMTLSLVALAMVIFRQTLNYANSIEIERIKWLAGQRLAVRFFEAVLGSEAANIQAYNPGQFVNAANYECQAAAAILRSFGALWMLFITLAAYGAILFVTAPVASLVAFGVILVAMFCLGALIRITARLSRHGIAYREQYVNFLTERFRAWKIIKLGNTLELERDKADVIQGDVVANQISLLKVSGALQLIFIPVLSAFLLATLYIFVEVLSLEVSVVMAFLLILLRLMPVSQSIQGGLNRLAQFLPSFDRIRRALDAAHARREHTEAGRKIAGIEQNIRFEGVSFAYPEREDRALHEVTVEIPARQMTALIGPSGAGKSTLVDLIPRIIDPDEGVVSIDGMPLKDISLGSLRRLIAYVPQAPFLFDASVADNIRYGNPEASDSEVREAARQANAIAFIETMPKGFASPLGDAGTRLSGGQKQRIVLARAFLSGAPILIFDEPTSALDYESETAIQESVERLVELHERTVIVIAHRLSTIRNADLVIQLEDGKILAVDKAQEVLRKLNDTDAIFNVSKAPATA